MMKSKIILFILFLVLATGCSSAAVYVVNSTNNSISSVVQNLNAGDVLIFQSGEYTPYGLTITKDGTSDNPIIITSLTGANFNGSSHGWSNSNNVLFNTAGHDWVQYSNFTIKNYYNGFRTSGCENVTVENITYVNNSHAIVGFDRAKNCNLVDCNITDTYWNAVQLSGQTITPSTNNVVTGCEFSNMIAHGCIDIMGSIKNATISDNYFHDTNNQHAIYAHQTQGYAADNVSIIGNHFHNTYSAVYFDDPVNNVTFSNNWGDIDSSAVATGGTLFVVKDGGNRVIFNNNNMTATTNSYSPIYQYRTNFTAINNTIDTINSASEIRLLGGGLSKFYDLFSQDGQIAITTSTGNHAELWYPGGNIFSGSGLNVTYNSTGSYATTDTVKTYWINVKRHVGVIVQ